MPNTSIRGSSTAPLWVLLAASLLIPPVLFGIASWLNYRSALADAGQDLLRTAEVASVQAARVFDGQSQVVDRVNDLVRGLDTAAVIQAEKPLHDSFAAIIANLPQVQTMLLCDADGRPLVSGATYPIPGGISVTDRDYYQAIVIRKHAGSFITRLQVGNVNRQSFFGLARPWLDANGATRGVVDVAVSPAFFADYYRNLAEEAPGGAAGRIMALVRDDGEILVRFPPIADSTARPMSNAAAFLTASTAHPQGGVYVGRSARDDGQPPRLFGYHRVEGYPAYVISGRNREAAIAAWRATMGSHLVFGLPATLALVAVSSLALVRTRRERRALSVARAEVRRREQAEAGLLRAQRLEAVGQMTGGVAHDFNNLLTVILGSAELLSRRADNPDRVRQLAEQIVLASQRGGQITQQLLTFSRRQFLSAEVVDVNRLLLDFLPLLERAAGERITLQLDLAAGPHAARLDAGHFEAALLNLVGNARDAMTEAGRILVTTRGAALPAGNGTDLPAGAYVRLSVADTGGGMDPDVAAKAFEPFFTTKGIGQGTGLGLSQVYGFAKQAGGDARITTSPGQGTTVELLLPRTNPVEAGIPSPELQRRSTPDGEVIVLVAEDDDAVRGTVVATLRDLGYATVTATDARAALDRLAAAGAVDLLFCAVTLPGDMDGWALAAAARERQPDLRVLLSSGTSAGADRRQAGDVPVIRKPFSQAQLSDAVRKALQW